MQNLATKDMPYISRNNSGALILKKIRMHLGFTQEKLANKIGISNQTVSAWECGKREIPLEDLRNIFKMFNLDIKDFINLVPSTVDCTHVLYCKICGSIHINTYPVPLNCCGHKTCEIENLEEISCPYRVSEESGIVYVTIDTSQYKNHHVQYIAYISKSGAEVKFTPAIALPQAEFKYNPESKLYAFRNSLGLFCLYDTKTTRR